jgi:hypothetical protein
LYLVLLVFGAHMGMAWVDLPRLWRNRELRREFWSVVVLLLLGLGLALLLVTGRSPISAFKVIERIVRPVGLLFKPKEQ